jgi:2',3'-cyclic-nucleotide 2'-phosphodiesterase (5'-nucleotidase family)
MTRSWTRGVLAAAVAIALVACASVGERAANDLLRLTLLQINDHYVLDPVDGGRRGGMARLATLVREIRRENPNTIFALAGDFLSPSVESTYLQGAQMIGALDAIGLDLATFGNHEFDFGPAILLERMRESKFRWLSANVLDRRSGRPFGTASADALLTLGGLRVGFFGLTTPETAQTSRPGPDVAFGPAVAAGRQAGASLRARGAMVVVAVTHQPMADDRAWRPPPTSTSSWVATSTSRWSPRKARPSSPRPAPTRAISFRSTCGSRATGGSSSGPGASAR